jgi:hypothetical protein
VQDPRLYGDLIAHPSHSKWFVIGCKAGEYFTLVLSFQKEYFVFASIEFENWQAYFQPASFSLDPGWLFVHTKNFLHDSNNFTQGRVSSHGIQQVGHGVFCPLAC